MVTSTRDPSNLSARHGDGSSAANPSRRTRLPWQDIEPTPGWRVGRDGLVRPLVLRAVLSFWNNRDADLWVNQRILVTHVCSIIRGVNKDTVRAVLDEMATQQVLLRHCPSPRRTVYRVAARFSDPVAAGYAREVDELLLDPIPWVTPDGRFLRIGRTNASRTRVYSVATFPHYFAKHVWMRGWIYAMRTGLLKEPATGLHELATACRLATVDLMWRYWRQRERDDVIGATGRAFERTRLWRMGPPSDSGPAAAAREHAELAMRMLHDACGHTHLQPLLGPSLLRLTVNTLQEPDVYLGLDQCVANRLGVSPTCDPAHRQQEWAGKDPIPWDADLKWAEPLIRGADPRLRQTFTDHRRAWPSGLGPAPARL